MHLPLLANKKPFQSEKNETNREVWGNVKARKNDLSCFIHRPFLSSPQGGKPKLVARYQGETRMALFFDIIWNIDRFVKIN